MTGQITTCLCLSAAALAATVSQGRSQSAAPMIHERTAAVSDEVALQRMRALGGDQPRILRRDGDRITVQGNRGGQQTTVTMNRLRGTQIDGTPAPDAAIASERLTGPQLREPRAALSHPDLMRDAVRPRP